MLERSSPWSALVWGIVPLVAGLVFPAPARAAPRGAAQHDTLTGELFESVVSLADSTQRYALLLPPDYRGTRPRPLLFVLDPRGRAVQALERFRDAAALGWLVMSSYGTRSDVADPSVNERALRAMVADAQTQLAVDVDRLYLAGFSGTARLGWLLAASLSPPAAGLVGVGAGFPTGLPSIVGVDTEALPDHFAFWGGSGRTDFNYEEVRTLDERLDAAAIRHRIRHFPGPHAWLPREEAAEAIAWLELAAVRAGREPPRAGWVDSLHRAWSTRARRALASGDTAAAADRWREIVDDFEGLVQVEEARERWAVLAASAAIRRREERRARERAEHRAFGDRFWRLVGEMGEGRTPSATRIVEELGIPALRDRRDGPDAEDAEQAARLLALVYVQTSFYMPRTALERGEPNVALVALEVAEAADPGRLRTCLMRARAHAAAGEREAAFRALSCVRERGSLPTAALTGDPWLAPLRDDPRWSEAVGPP